MYCVVPVPRIAETSFTRSFSRTLKAYNGGQSCSNHRQIRMLQTISLASSSRSALHFQTAGRGMFTILLQLTPAGRRWRQQQRKQLPEHLQRRLAALSGKPEQSSPSSAVLALNLNPRRPRPPLTATTGFLERRQRQQSLRNLRIVPVKVTGTFSHNMVATGASLNAFKNTRF